MLRIIAVVILAEPAHNFHNLKSQFCFRLSTLAAFKDLSLVENVLEILRSREGIRIYLEFSVATPV